MNTWSIFPVEQMQSSAGFTNDYDFEFDVNPNAFTARWRIFYYVLNGAAMIKEFKISKYSTDKICLQITFHNNNDLRDFMNKLSDEIKSTAQIATQAYSYNWQTPENAYPTSMVESHLAGDVVTAKQICSVVGQINKLYPFSNEMWEQITQCMPQLSKRFQPLTLLEQSIKVVKAHNTFFANAINTLPAELKERVSGVNAQSQRANEQSIISFLKK
jgi:hypothetical protein